MLAVIDVGKGREVPYTRIDLSSGIRVMERSALDEDCLSSVRGLTCPVFVLRGVARCLFSVVRGARSMFSVVRGARSITLMLCERGR